MENSKYFADAQSEAHDTYYGADGFFEDSYGGNNTDTSFPMEGDYAANGGGAFKPTSQPFIVKVENTTGAAVANVIVLGSYENLFGTTNFGNPAAIQLTSGVPNVTYIQMLKQFENQPFVTGLTYIQSSNTSQVLEVVTVRHQDANGNLQDYPIIPTIDPYQEQATVIPVGFNYRVDGYTKFTIGSVAANTTVTFRLYPRAKADLSLGLVGQNVERGYANPDVIKAQPISVSQQALSM